MPGLPLNHTINALKASLFHTISILQKFVCACGKRNGRFLESCTFFLLKFTWFICTFAPIRYERVFQMELISICSLPNRIFQLKFMIYLHIFSAIHWCCSLNFIHRFAVLVVECVREKRVNESVPFQETILKKIFHVRVQHQVETLFRFRCESSNIFERYMKIYLW